MSLMYIRLLATMYVHKLHTLSMFINFRTFFSVWVLITKWSCRYECSNTSKSSLSFLWKEMLPMRLLES